MTFAVTPLTGINISDPTSATANFAVGGKALLTNGVEAMYVLAGAAIAAGDVLQVSQTGVAVPITTTLTGNDTTTAALTIAVANVAITNAQYGWAITRGPCSINALASCVKGAPLYTTGTAGAVDDAATNLIAGLMLTATVGGAQAVTDGVASNPVLVRGTVGA